MQKSRQSRGPAWKILAAGRKVNRLFVPGGLSSLFCKFLDFVGILMELFDLAIVFNG